MSDIPMFSARGNTDSEKIAEIMSYLSGLSSSIDRELLSIDFSNLNGDLADRINKSVTEHQDLSGFASKNYAKNHFYDKESVNAMLENFYTKQYINSYFYNIYEIDAKLDGIIDRIEALEKG